MPRAVAIFWSWSGLGFLMLHSYFFIVETFITDDCMDERY